MASFDSPYLLKMFNRYTGRPATGDSITDADKYERITEGQTRVIQDMFARVPNSLYPHTANLPAMTSVASGNIWTFGTDSNGYAVTPMGKARIFPNQASFPNYCWVEGVDYVNEGTQIRLTNGRTWSTPLYWYGITLPADITASVQPSLFPETFRDLIVYQAVLALNEEGMRNADMTALMESKYARRFPEACLAWKTQFSSGGALGSLTGLRMTEAGGSLNGQSWS